jgi:hypothetical protein
MEQGNKEIASLLQFVEELNEDSLEPLIKELTESKEIFLFIKNSASKTGRSSTDYLVFIFTMNYTTMKNVEVLLVIKQQGRQMRRKIRFSHSSTLSTILIG